MKMLPPAGADGPPRQRRVRLIPLLLLAPAILLVGLFLYYPLLFIVQMSFTIGNSFLAQNGPVVSVANYQAMLDRYLPNVLVTVRLAAIATIIDLLFGYPFAYILIRKVGYRDLVRAFMIFPMFGTLYIAFGMSFILLPGGFASPLLDVLGISYTAIMFNLPAVIFAMSIFTFPFMVMNIGTALGNVDPKLEEAAVCLGASPAQSFTRIVLPLTRAGIVAGCLMVFGWSVGTFAEPLLLGSINEQKSLAYALYQRGVIQADYGLSTTMGIILVVIAFVVSYSSLRFSRGSLVE